jgi:hypothetical protein
MGIHVDVQHRTTNHGEAFVQISVQNRIGSEQDTDSRYLEVQGSMFQQNIVNHLPYSHENFKSCVAVGIFPFEINPKNI